MATSQKKTGGSRSASSSSGGRRTASSSSKSKSGSSRSRKQPPAPAHRPFRREVGAGICLLLAIFTIFGCFRIQALFIDALCGLIKGLIGYGFWLMPPALLLASFILAFHRGRPVRLRVFCALMLPLMFSCVVHSVIAESLPWDASLAQTLWQSGEALSSGGVLAGILGQAFVQVFSRVGAAVVFVLALLMLGLGAFNRTIVDVADWFFSRPRYEYEPQDPPERPVVRVPQPAPRTSGRRTEAPDIDIPVDDGPLVGKEAPPPPEKKKHFFDRRPRVPTPDQILTGGAAGSPEPQSVAPASQPEPAPELEEANPTPAFLSAQAPQPEPQESNPIPAYAAAEPAPSPAVSAPVEAPPPPMPEVVREPAVPKSAKSEKAEAEQAAQEMAEHIQAGMAQEPPPYHYPPLDLLQEGKGELGGEALVELNANKQRLSDTIHSFGIDANIVNVTRGPSVTRYELELDQGVRLNKLTNLSDDIALSLGASGVRIAPIPGKISMVGIEVPNKLVSPVNIRTVLSSQEFQDSPSKVSFAVGKDIGGKCIVGNIAKLPHLLIAGTTGSGKSVCTNSLIISLLYKASPEEVRLIMVDPKMVELGIYNGIPHLLIPVVTDPKKAAGALQWAVTEMMKRYRMFAEVGVRDLASYNAKAAKTEGMDTMPQVVVVIDELADLMLVAAKEVEESICRVAQMGRASGMHLIIATQRPSADVITGLMKANIPSRIAFAVASAMESRIILDTQGAEKLVGRGDMLYFPLGSGKPTRVQGCLISDQEVAAVVDYVKQNSGSAQYDDQVMQEIEQHAAEKDKASKGVGGSSPVDGEEEYDELINSAIEVVLETGQASVSMLQRRLKLGYARAARLVDQMEEKGVVGPFEGSKARQLLITKEQWQEMQYRQGIVSLPPEPEAPPAEENPAPPYADAPPFDVDEALDRAEEDTL